MNTIRIPCGRVVSVAAYVRAWRKLLTLPADFDIPGRQWEWFPTTAAAVLADMRRAVHDRINKRAKLDPPEDNRSPQARLARRITAGLVVRSCRWCGRDFKPAGINQRTCSDSCARSLCP